MAVFRRLHCSVCCSLRYCQLRSALQITGIKIIYWTDGHFFDLWRMKATTKIKETMVCEFLIADDCAVTALTKEKPATLAD